MANPIHVIARAIIVDDGHILVTHPSHEAGYTYLPGGHVEIGEQAGKALLRELTEELGITDATVENFVGTIEACFTRKTGVVQHEVCLLFMVHSPSLSHEQVPVSCEPHIGFRWVPLTQINSAQILPVATVTFLQQLNAAVKPFFFSAFEG